MNCKQGDLAIIIGGVFPQFFGKIIKVTKIDCDFPYCWETEPPLSSGESTVVMADFHLKPIRPGDGEDEMLRIAGKPAERPVHAV